MQSDRAQCEAVQRSLAMTGDQELIDLSARRHVESCLQCQAEAVRFQKMFRALSELRTTTLVAPVGLLEDTLAALDELPGGVRSIRRRTAVAGALGAVAAGAAATIVIVARSRRRALAA